MNQELEDLMLSNIQTAAKIIKLLEEKLAELQIRVEILENEKAK